MSNILGPNGNPVSSDSVSTSKKTPTRSSEERRRISEMCELFGVSGFEDDLINEGLSSAEAWDRLVRISDRVHLLHKKAYMPRPMTRRAARAVR